MHLEGPWLTTTGKIKSKRRKFASADAARRARELKAEWEQRQQEWDKMSPNFSRGLKVKAGKVKTTSPVVTGGPVIDPSRDTRQYRSLDTGVGVAAKPAAKIYTGTLIKGIATMHKSNAVPVLNDDDAVAIAHMRR